MDSISSFEVLNLFKSLKDSSLYLSWKNFASYFSSFLTSVFILSLSLISFLLVSIDSLSSFEVLNLFKSLKDSSLYLSWKKFASYFSFCLKSSISLGVSFFSSSKSFSSRFLFATLLAELSLSSGEFLLEFLSPSIFSATLTGLRGLSSFRTLSKSPTFSYSASLLGFLDELILDFNFFTSEKTELMLSLFRYIFMLSKMFKELRANL